ncbi:MAG TPA: FMN-binding negative transcriptional regulator [Gemmataceae bacterium]|jgi:transcriptional regulator|nr:FMN-binding negative transcriptional regulator [Gemmataceae bacterium]
MYVPAHFAESDLGVLHQFIEEHPFGLLISQQDGLPFATHLPFLLDRAAGPNGTLLGHVARQNPQWQQLVGQQVLAVFHGTHAYISPTWYATDQTVPTWNYVAVHAYGTVELIEEPAVLVELVRELTRVAEQSMPTPWSFDPADPFVHKLAAQIVGFRITITNLEGKWKLNQNHPRERRQQVIDALRAQGDGNAVGIAELMSKTLPG